MEKQKLIYNKLINKYNFDEKQKQKIIFGLQNRLDVNWYAKPEFDHFQMDEIIIGLKNNLNVSL